MKGRQAVLENTFEDPRQLKLRREALGLSQAELARRTGISPSVVRDCESGRLKLRGDRAQRLWDAILAEHTARAQPKNALVERLRAIERGENPPVTTELKIPVDDVVAWAEKHIQIEEEVGRLRTEMAEMHRSLEKLLARSEKSTADEGARILSENGVTEE